MDANRFDDLTRTLLLPSRRGLLGSLLVGALATLGLDTTAAKKKQK